MNTQTEKWVDGVLFGVVDGNTPLETGLKRIRTRLAREGLAATLELLMPILGRIEDDTMGLTGGFTAKRPERLANLAQLRRSLNTLASNH